MICNDKWDTCRVEKLGCEGCYYNEKTSIKSLKDIIKKLNSDLYAANCIISDYIDITNKQDKIIDLMAFKIACLNYEFIDDWCHKNKGILCKDCDTNNIECIKEHFKNIEDENLEI